MEALATPICTSTSAFNTKIDSDSNNKCIRSERICVIVVPKAVHSKSERSGLEAVVKYNEDPGAKSERRRRGYNDQ
jgi:hypothetical protein